MSAPTPWRVHRFSSGTIRIMAGDPAVAVCELMLLDDPDPFAEANAEFIVRACNAHDEMLEALRTTAGNIRSLGPAGALGESYREWLRVVEDAIARAEGRA